MDGQNENDDLLTRMAAITGEKPTAKQNTLSKKQDLLRKMMGSVSSQESNGRTSIVNPDSGAMGEFQVMPFNVRPWTKKYLNREMSPEEFRNDPEAQRRVFEGEMGSYLDGALKRAKNDEEAIRMAAVRWYGGNYEDYDDPTPQYSNGRQYPSRREYTAKVANRIFGNLKTNQSSLQNTSDLLNQMKAITEGANTSDDTLARMKSITNTQQMPLANSTPPQNQQPIVAGNTGTGKPTVPPIQQPSNMAGSDDAARPVFPNMPVFIDTKEGAYFKTPDQANVKGNEARYFKNNENFVVNTFGEIKSEDQMDTLKKIGPVIEKEVKVFPFGKNENPITVRKTFRFVRKGDKPGEVIFRDIANDKGGEVVAIDKGNGNYEFPQETQSVSQQRRIQTQFQPQQRVSKQKQQSAGGQIPNEIPLADGRKLKKSDDQSNLKEGNYRFIDEQGDSWIADPANKKVYQEKANDIAENIPVKLVPKEQKNSIDPQTAKQLYINQVADYLSKKYDGNITTENPNGLQIRYEDVKPWMEEKGLISKADNKQLTDDKFYSDGMDSQSVNMPGQGGATTQHPGSVTGTSIQDFNNPLNASRQYQSTTHAFTKKELKDLAQFSFTQKSKLEDAALGMLSAKGEFSPDDIKFFDEQGLDIAKLQTNRYEDYQLAVTKGQANKQRFAQRRDEIYKKEGDQYLADLKAKKETGMLPAKVAQAEIDKYTELKESKRQEFLGKVQQGANNEFNNLNLARIGNPNSAVYTPSQIDTQVNNYMKQMLEMYGSATNREKKIKDEEMAKAISANRVANMSWGEYLTELGTTVPTNVVRSALETGISGTWRGIALAANFLDDNVINLSGGKDKNVEDYASYQIAENFSKYLKEYLPINEDMVNSGGLTGFIAGDFSQGLGSSFGMIPGGYAKYSKTAIAFLSSLQMGGDAYREARELGISPEKAQYAALAQMPLGATEIFGMGKILERLNTGKGATVWRKLFADAWNNAVTEVPEEIFQEGLQTVSQNIIQNKMYDPDKQWSEGALKAMAAAGLSAGVSTAGVSILNHIRLRKVYNDLIKKEEANGVIIQHYGNNEAYAFGQKIPVNAETQVLLNSFDNSRNGIEEVQAEIEAVKEKARKDIAKLRLVSLDKADVSQIRDIQKEAIGKLVNLRNELNQLQKRQGVIAKEIVEKAGIQVPQTTIGETVTGENPAAVQNETIQQPDQQPQPQTKPIQEMKPAIPKIGQQPNEQPTTEIPVLEKPVIETQVQPEENKPAEKSKNTNKAETAKPDTKQEFEHVDFGRVTETDDQSNVPQNKVRVEDKQGKFHIIQKPGKTGKGNQKAIPVKVRGLSFDGENKTEEDLLSNKESESNQQVSESEIRKTDLQSNENPVNSEAQPLSVKEKIQKQSAINALNKINRDGFIRVAQPQKVADGIKEWLGVDVEVGETGVSKIENTPNEVVETNDNSQNQESNFENYFNNLKKDKMRSYKNRDLAKRDFHLRELQNVFENEIKADNFGKGIRRKIADINEGISRQFKEVEPSTLAYVDKKLSKLVEKALKEGKEISAEVLADYPDLAKQYSKDTQVSESENKDTETPKSAPKTEKQKTADERFQKIQNAKQNGINKEDREGQIQTENDNDIEEVPVSQRVDVEDLEGAEFTRSEVERKSKKEKIRKTGFTKTQEEWFVDQLQKEYDKLEPTARIVEMDGARLRQLNRDLVDKGGKYQGKSLEFARSTPEYLEAKAKYEKDIQNAVVIDIPGDGIFKFSSAEGINSIHKKLTGKTIEQTRQIDSANYEIQSLPKNYTKAGKEAQIRQEDDTDITVAKVNELLGDAPKTNEVLSNLGLKQVSNGYWRSGNGKFIFEVSPKPIKLNNLPGYDLFAHKYGKYWRISEAVTGLSLIDGQSTLDAAVAKASNQKLENFEKALKKSIAESGMSPRYEEISNKESQDLSDGYNSNFVSLDQTKNDSSENLSTEKKLVNNSGLKAIEENNDWQFDENELNLIDEQGNINYEQLQNISDGIERGNIAITRLNEAEERGRGAAGRRNVEASILAGTSETTGSENERESRFVRWDDHKQAVKNQEEILEKYAKDNGIWFKFDNFNRDYIYLDRGMESDVFFDEKTQNVVKVVGYDFAERISPLQFIDNRIAIHNTLFPSTNYQLIGFTKDNSGFFRFVLSQPFIQDSGEISEAELEQYLKNTYDLTKNENGKFINARYQVHDLHALNVIKGENGIIHFIDPIISLNTDNVEVPKFALRNVKQENPRLKAIEEEAAGPEFYSAVERTIENAKQEKFSIDQVKALFKTPGIKQEELDWMGMDAFLDGKTKITKSELLDFVRSNSVEIVDVIKDNEPNVELVTTNDIVRIDKSSDRLLLFVEFKNGRKFPLNKSLFEKGSDDEIKEVAVQRYNERWSKGIPSNPTKYSQYVLPGGENYKELLLTLPTTKETDFFNWLEKRIGTERFNKIGRSAAERYKQEFEDSKKDVYQSSHWDEPNVLAHIRFDERTDENGLRTLHIAEIQSDWAQQGRKKGFSMEKVPDSYTTEIVEKDNGLQGYLKNEKGEIVFEKWTSLNNPFGVVSDDLLKKEYLKEKNREAVPDMPFKKTDSWAGLAFKKMLRYAVENGFDAISWDTGKTNVDRYDLSKQISSLQYKKNENGNYDIHPFGLDGIEITDNSFKNLNESKLEDTIGKEIAQKIVNEEGESKKGGYKKLAGVDLQVGGEGMVGFYDRILPSFVSKYIKKWGAKLGFSEISQGEGGYKNRFLVQASGVIRSTFPTKEEAEEEVSKFRNNGINAKVVDSKPPNVTIHSVSITPAMRESVLQGQPLFAMTEEEKKAAFQAAKIAPTSEIAYKSEVTRHGSTIHLNIEAQEVLRRAAEEADIRAGRKKIGDTAIEGSFSGQFYDYHVTNQTLAILRSVAKEAKAAGYVKGAEAIAKIADEIEAAREAGKGTFVAYVFDEKLPHEMFHQASYLGDLVRDLQSRHAKAKELDAHKAAQATAEYLLSFGEYQRMKKQNPLLFKAVVREEAAAYIAGGELFEGLTEDDAADFMNLWFDSYIEKNGVESLENFEKVDGYVQEIIEQIKNALAEKENAGNRRSGESVSGKQEQTGNGTSGGNESSSGKGSSESKETDRRLPAGGKLAEIEQESDRQNEFRQGLKNRQYAETLRENGRNSYQDDVFYLPESEKSWTENANKIIADSQEKNPDNPFEQAIKEFNNSNQPESFRAVLGVALIDHLGAEGNYAEMKKIADKTVEIVGTAGQVLRASQIVSKYDFAKGVEIATRGMKKLGKDLSPSQIEEIKQKTGRYSAASENEAINTHILEEIKTELENTENELSELQNAYSDLEKSNQKISTDLIEAQKKGRIAKRLATFYKNRLENTSYSRKSAVGSKVLRKTLEINKSDDLNLLQELFGENIALKSIAEESNNNQDERLLTDSQRGALVRQVQRMIVAETPASYSDVMKNLELITKNQVSEQTLQSIHAEAINGIRKETIDVEKLDAETRAAYEKAKINRQIRAEHRSKAKKFEKSGEKGNTLSPLNQRIIKKVNNSENLSDSEKEKLITAMILLANSEGAKAWYEGFAEAYKLTNSENDEWFSRAIELKKELKKIIYQEQIQKRAEKEKWEGSVVDFENKLIESQKAKRDAKRSLDSHYKELHKSIWEKAIDTILFPFDLMRTAMSTGEISQIGRQGFPTLLTFPKAWAKSLKGIKTGLGNPTTRFAFVKAIENDADFKESVRYGMPYAGFGENAVGDEHFPINRFINRLADKDFKGKLGISKVPVVGTLLSKTAKAQQRFEQAYTDPADLQRLFIYKTFKSIIESQGLNEIETDKAKKRAVYYAQILSGKGSLPKVFGEKSIASRLLASIGFAPNLLASRFETAFHFNPILAPVLAPKGLKGTMFTKGLQLYSIPALLALALAALFKPDDDDDDTTWSDIINPKSKRFLKVTIRGTDINLDVSSGMSEFQRLMFYDWANLVYAGITGGKDSFVKTAENLAQNEENTFLNTRFLRGKLAPGASLGVDIYTGADFLGHPISWKEGGYWGAITGRYIPITYQHIYDSLFYDEGHSLLKEPYSFQAGREKLARFRAANIPVSLLLGSLEALGLSATQYEKTYQSVAKDVAWSMYRNNYENKNPQLSRVKTELRKLFRRKDKLMEIGKDTGDIDLTIKEITKKYSDLVTKDDIAEVRKQAQESNFAYVTKKMTVQEIERIISVATDSEKIELEEILKKKMQGKALEVPKPKIPQIPKFKMK